MKLEFLRVASMTTAYDVPPGLLIERLKDRLQQEGKIKPPEWAPFVRTGVHTEKAPVQPDWWYRRVAAVLRKVYLKGPVGTSRLAAEFGGRRDDGSAPYHPRRGSRSIAREAMQQLESMGLLVKVEKRGRSISPQGRKLLDSLSHEILLELAKVNPELSKYAGGA
jgi:small subunit ribosomal protein S19e